MSNNVYEEDIEDSKLVKSNPVIHYRFKREINNLNCYLQLYIVEEKIKIIVNCSETYSREYQEYLNYYSINDLQQQCKYFCYFNTIQEIFEDFANILKENKYIIEKDSNFLLLTIQISINGEQKNVCLTLNRNKNKNNYQNTKPSQILNSIKSSEDYSRKKILLTSKNIDDIEKSQRNVGVTSVNELNNLLTDLKDRLTVLEVTQNTTQMPIMNNNNSDAINLMKEQERLLSLANSSYNGSGSMLLGMETIFKRINKLEEANNEKDKKIKVLEEKLKNYEPGKNIFINDSYNDNISNPYNSNYYKYNNNNIKKFDSITLSSNINSNNTLNNNNTLLEIREELNSSNMQKKKEDEKNNSSEYFNLGTIKQKLSNYENDKKNEERFNQKKENDEKDEKKSNSKHHHSKNKSKKSHKKDKNKKEEDKEKDKEKNNIEIINTDVQKNDNEDYDYLNNRKKNLSQKKTKGSDNINKIASSLINNKDLYSDIDNNEPSVENVNKEENKKNNNENNNIKNNIIKSPTKNKKNTDREISNSPEKKKTKENNFENINSPKKNENIINSPQKNNTPIKINFNAESSFDGNLYPRNDNQSKNSENSRKKNYKKLPIYPREDLRKYVNSRIIFTKKELRLLKKKINNGDKNQHVFFDLLYRASIDGANEEIIRKNTKNQTPTLTLFYTYEGARFGLYIEKQIEYSIFGTHAYREKPSTSFLISLNHKEIYDIYDGYIATNNTYDTLCFIKSHTKSKNGTYWIIYTPPKNFLGEHSCFMGNAEEQPMFEIDDMRDIVGDSLEYHLKDVEIFKVAIESDSQYQEEKNYEVDENVLNDKHYKDMFSNGEMNHSINKSNDVNKVDNNVVNENEKNSVKEDKNNNDNNKNDKVVSDNNNNNNVNLDDVSESKCEFYLAGIIKGVKE